VPVIHMEMQFQGLKPKFLGYTFQDEGCTE